VSQPTLNTFIRSSPDGWHTAKRELVISLTGACLDMARAGLAISAAADWLWLAPV
jgi:hypothetical protein